MASLHRFFAELSITDPEAFATDLGSTAEDILAGMIRPAVPPVASGFEIMEKKWTEDRGRARIEIAALVADPEKLFAAARQAYLECWSDDHWEPDHPEEALYELLLASNANPSPDVMGFAFEDWGPLPALPAPPPDTEDLTP